MIVRINYSYHSLWKLGASVEENVYEIETMSRLITDFLFSMELSDLN